MTASLDWVVLREKRRATLPSRLLGLPVIQGVLHGFDTLYDMARYLRHSPPPRSRARERRRLEALLFLHFHKIEKTLSLPSPPRPFGTSYLGELLDLLDQWQRTIGDPLAVAFRGAEGALRQYRDVTGTELSREFPALAARLDRFLATQGCEGETNGGSRRLTAAEFRAASGNGAFERLAAARHSVRHFSPEPVSEEAVTRAVRIAQRTPSVCNRQAWRVHVYSSPADKEAVLRTQDGNAGFGHEAARVLLVTGDARAYVTSGERHQAYVDGGMFAMSLVYALQAEGIASCCLNLCNYFFQDVAVHRVCRIPAWELPIMMIAIGHPPPEFGVAASPRRDVDEVLAWRTL